MSDAIDLLSISAPLSGISFEVSAIRGQEQLSRPFVYTVELQSGSAPLDRNALLDQPMTVTLGDPSGHGRYVSGIIRAARQVPYPGQKLWRYEFTVVPKLWFLGQTQDCRFFQKMAVPDIVAAIFNEFGVTSTSKLQNSYKARDYVVQFNESYLDFVQRILEDAGIFYFFTHEENSHTLILADSNAAFPSIPLPSVLLDNTAQGFGTLASWEQQDTTAIGSIRLDDYNPETDSLTPGAISGTEQTVFFTSAASQRRHYHWPAGRSDTALTKKLAERRMLATEAAAKTMSGSGELLHFVAGGTFSLANDPLNGGAATNYVITSVSYTASDTAAGTSGGGGGVSMRCTAIPAATAYVAEPSVTAPVMAGLYSAVVIGASAEEVYTDDLGRIQVRFPSDNHNDITTENTLWVRVMQGWAGNNWGIQFTPRVGMEVAVAFLEGDVNRPVVVGCLFNEQNKPIFATAAKNKSGLRTRSTKNGGSSNFNELSFDDTTGSELFYLHAEKDFTLEVEHDHSVTVTNDETVTIQGTKTDTVTGDHALTVSQGNHATTVSQGNKSTIVSAGNETLDVTKGSVSHSAGQSITLAVGNNSLAIDTSSITLTVGGNSIQLTASGITINGMQVKVAAQTQTAISGAIVSVQAQGALELTGSITKINS